MNATELFFRGQRNYIHGADILQWVQNNTAKASLRQVDYMVMKPAIESVMAIPFAEGQRSIAVASYKDSGIHLLIVPTGEKVTRRIADDEQEGEKQMSYTDGIMEILQPFPGMSPVRQAVVAFKALLRHTHGAGVYQYKFVRLVYGSAWHPPFTLRFTRVVGGRFFEGQISHGNQEYAKLYFGQGQ